MVIAVVNQKGGTGKTTTTVNVGRVLATKNYKVLLVDLDPQGNLSYSLGVNQFEHSVANVLRNEVSIVDAVIEIEKEDMDVLPTSTQLAKLELSQTDAVETAYSLKNALSELGDHYDFVLIDCPPSLSWLTINALSAADKVLIPMQLDVFSIQGLSQIIATIEEMKDQYNNNLEILGVLAVMVDARKKLTKEVIDHVVNNFEVNVFKHQIRTNVKAAEAPSFGESVINYAPSSNSASDYIAATEEILASM